MDGRHRGVPIDLTTIKTKAGYIGQVMVDGNIVWESEPIPDTEGYRPSDGAYDPAQDGSYLAQQAARKKIMGVLEGLFA